MSQPVGAIDARFGKCNRLLLPALARRALVVILVSTQESTAALLLRHTAFDLLPRGCSFGGVMLKRGALACGAMLLLSGCVTGSGTDFTSLSQQVGPPKSGQSRIVVLQEKREGLSPSICACEIKLDGEAIGKAKPGTYVYAIDRRDAHWLIASELPFPGDSKREIRTESGRTSFFVVRASKRHDALTGVGIVGGLAGIAVASIATAGNDNPGPADIYPLDDAAARTTLTDLQLSD